MSLACTRCGDKNVRKSSLHSSDGLLRILFYAPYRCRVCHFRFWASSPLKPFLLAAILGFGTLGSWWLANREPTPAGRLTETAYGQVSTRAVSGDADAELQMGLRYAEGDGVIKNNKEAALWFEKAARHDKAEAQYRYGLALLQGRGVVQDYKAAFHWIEQPARRGHSQAQYSLGELYRYGTGTERDLARAYLWFNLAAAQGVDLATKARDSLVWQLKPEQIAAMQEEARRISRGEQPVAGAAKGSLRSSGEPAGVPPTGAAPRPPEGRASGGVPLAGAPKDAAKDPAPAAQ